MLDLFKHHEDPRVRALVALFDELEERIKAVSKSLDALTAQVDVTVSTEATAVTTIQTGANDSAQLDALAAKLKTSSDALAAANAAVTTTPPPTQG
jgi:uncharacterized coiled-coil protein SlyX